MFSSNCEINYSGRAESYLPLGERLVIIKPDKTLLVHQPKGSNPVNYMKEKSKHKIIIENGILCLKSENQFLKEYLEIKIDKIHFLQTIALQDKEKIQIKGSEKDMSDFIYNNPELIEKGFKPLSREEHTKYGFIDVFGNDKKNNLVIVECKRYSADFNAVSQLRRYVEKIKKSKGLDKVRGIIAAPKISPNALKMAQDFGFSYVRVIPPKYLEKFKSKQKKIDQF